MKRILLIVLTILILFTGCNSFADPSSYEGLGNVYHEKTDFPYRFFSEHAVFYVTPGENGYYLFVGEILCFFDKETMNTVAVCNRPECLHQDDTCSAYFKREYSTFLQFYNGKIYVETFEPGGFMTETVYLYEVDPNTCTRQKICQLPYSYDTATKYMMHRGYLYMVNNAMERDEATDETIGVYRIERVALNVLQEESLTPELLFQKEGNTLGFWGNPLIYGEYLIFGTAELTGDTSEEILYAYHLKEHRITEVPLPKAEEGARILVDGARDGNFILTYIAPEVSLGESFETTYYEYDPKSNDFQFLATFADRGENISECLRWDGERWITTYFDILGKPESFHPNQEIRILNESFEVTDSFPVHTYTIGSIVGDEDFTFFGDGFYTGQLYAVDKRGEKMELIEIYKAS